MRPHDNPVPKALPGAGLVTFGGPGFMLLAKEMGWTIPFPIILIIGIASVIALVLSAILSIVWAWRWLREQRDPDSAFNKIRIAARRNVIPIVLAAVGLVGLLLIGVAAVGAYYYYADQPKRAEGNTPPTPATQNDPPPSNAQPVLSPDNQQIARHIQLTALISDAQKARESATKADAILKEIANLPTATGAVIRSRRTMALDQWGKSLSELRTINELAGKKADFSPTGTNDFLLEQANILIAEMTHELRTITDVIKSASIPQVAPKLPVSQPQQESPPAPVPAPRILPPEEADRKLKAINRVLDILNDEMEPIVSRGDQLRSGWWNALKDPSNNPNYQTDLLAYRDLFKNSTEKLEALRGRLSEYQDLVVASQPTAFNETFPAVEQFVIAYNYVSNTVKAEASQDALRFFMRIPENEFALAIHKFVSWRNLTRQRVIELRRQIVP